MHPAAVKSNKIALVAKIMVAKYLGFLYTASEYTFSPPEQGNIVPYSSHTKRPQNDSRKPRNHNTREAPMEPTELRMEGVENIPVPIIRPTLMNSEGQHRPTKTKGHQIHISMGQLNMPKWRPIPPEVSIIHGQKFSLELTSRLRTFLESQSSRIGIVPFSDSTHSFILGVYFLVTNPLRHGS